MVFKLVCITVAICAIMVHSAPVDRIKLRFRISARGLPDKDTIGTIDPYVEVFYTEDGKKDEIKLGRTSTITDNEDPDWGDVFEIDFDRSKHQRFHFKVYDEDQGREDDGGGKAYIDVADYVDKDQRLNANLSKKGYLIISSADPVVPQTGGVLFTPAPVVYQPAPPAPAVVYQQQQPAPAPAVYPAGPAPAVVYQSAQPAAPAVVYSQVNPDVLKLKFKLSARDLPDKDKLGLTDPFAELYYTENGSTKEIKFGRTATINDNKNPDWGDVFEFDYDRKKNQKFLIRIYDHDQGREDDSAGKVWIDVNDYVTKGQRLTSNLSKKGTLTIATTDAPGAPVLVSQQPQPQQVIVSQQPQPQQILVHQPQPQQVLVPQQPQQVLVPQQPQQVLVSHQPQQVIAAPVVPLVQVLQIQKLRFQLSAKGLDDKDIIGTSDPYVKIYYKQDGGASEINIGSTDKLSDTESPSWKNIFEFDYDRTKNPKWHFLILDDDDNRKDDELGDVWVDVGEYVQKNQNLDVKLKKGTLSIKSA